MRPTIKDVSKLAAVSIGTVSNVVNGHPNVSAKTRQRVQEAIEKLGYRANRAARSLPAGATGLLGFWLPRDPSPNAAMDVFLHRIVESASIVGLEVLLFAAKPGQSDIDAFADIFRRGGVDAFVISGVNYQDDRVSYLLERNIPFASFGRIESAKNAPWVDVDGVAGTRLATHHLIEQGRRRIGFVGWPEGSQVGDGRYQGWQKTLASAGLKHDENTCVRALDSFGNGVKAGARLRDLGCDAAVCVSDTLALGVIEGLRAGGLVIGEDFAVTGFDNVPAAALVNPGLTSLRQPMAKVGKALVDQIAAILDGSGVNREQMFEPELIVRGSSNPAAGIDA